MTVEEQTPATEHPNEASLRCILRLAGRHNADD